MKWKTVALGLRERVHRVACRAVPSGRVRLTLRRAAAGTFLLGLTAAGECDPLADLLKNPLATVYEERESMLYLSRDEVAAGSVDVPFDIVVTGSIARRPGTWAVDAVASSEGHPPIGEGRLPSWGELTILPGTESEISGGFTMTYRATLTLHEDAPIGGISIRARVLETGGDGVTGPPVFVYAGSPLNVSVSGTAPRIAGSASPAVGVRDSTITTDVAIPATNVAEPVTVLPADPLIAATAATYDAEFGVVRVSLRIPDVARTGATFLTVVNADGSHSLDVPFTVVDRPQVPVVSGFFPNFAHAGDALSSVLVGGSDFTVGADLATPLDQHLAHGLDIPLFARPTAGDSHTLLTSLSSAPAQDVSVTVQALGGDEVYTFQILGPSIQGPRITGVAPSSVVGGAPVQVRIDGSGLDGAVDVVGVATDQLETPFAGPAVIVDQHPDFVVAELHPSSAGGMTYLAVRTAGGLLSDAKQLTIVAPPPAAAPVLGAFAVGQIARGADVIETIYGHGLSDVTQAFVESGGVASSGVVVVEPDGDSLTVTLSAAVDAPLSADVATNLVLKAGDGRISNPLHYEVVAFASPLACPLVAGKNVHLSVSGAGNFGKTVDRVASVPASTGGPGTTLLNFSGDPNSDGSVQYLGFVLSLPPGQIQNGSIPAASLYFYDEGGSTWRKDPFGTVDVVDATPTSFRLCIDAVLRRPGGAVIPQDVAVRGYVIVSR